MNINLDGKVILVTGATRGIGRSIAEALDASGATVAAHGNSAVDESKEWASGLKKTTLFKADLTSNDQIVNLFDEVISKYGTIDVLINNAGVAIDSNWKKETTEWIGDWNKTLQINLTATGILCKKGLEHFESKGGGIIINIASRAAFRGDTMDYLAYASSKGAMVALTRSIARGMGKKGVTAFTIAPGFTRTAMAEQAIELYGEEFVATDIALNELTRPEDIAPFIVFLSSGMATHATGGTFDFNAGSYVH